MCFVNHYHLGSGHTSVFWFSYTHNLKHTYIHICEDEKEREGIYKISADDFHIKYVCMFLYKEQLIMKECQEVLPEL